jgi:hypothetical protein
LIQQDIDAATVSTAAAPPDEQDGPLFDALAADGALRTPGWRNNLLAVAICRDADDLYRYVAERLVGIDHI